MVVFTTKPIVPLNFCYKPACVKRIRLKYDNKSDLLFFAKPSKSVSLSKTIFFLNPEAYSDQWTDWSDTFFLSKLGQKPSNAGRPPFSPHYLWGAFDQSTCPRQPTPLAVHTSHSPVRRNIFLRSTFGTACVTLWTTFNRASTFTCHAILSMTPLAPHASHPFLQGQSSSVKKICLKFEVLAQSPPTYRVGSGQGACVWDLWCHWPDKWTRTTHSENGVVSIISACVGEYLIKCMALICKHFWLWCSLKNHCRTKFASKLSF